jgi:hypothetical protein
MNTIRPIRNISFPLSACYAGYLFYNFYELYNMKTVPLKYIEPLSIQSTSVNTTQQDIQALVREFIHP